MTYTKHIFFCLNERPADHPRGCCAARGGGDLFNYMKASMKERGHTDMRVNKAGCMDQCEQGPVLVIYPDAVWYSPKTRADIDEIIASHIEGGDVVEHLVMPKQKAA